MVKTESADTAVQEVANVLIAAADLSIPKNSSHSFQRYKPWWNADCQTAYKNQRKLWRIFRSFPTTENLLAFKKTKANARRLRRQSQRKSWIRYVSSLTSSTSSKQLWRKVKAANGIYLEFSFPILQTSDSVFSSPVEIATILGETFQSVSSTASYSSRFLEIKRRAESTPINFSTRSFIPYNCNFTMTELKKALLQAYNTCPGPDRITYTMLRHLNPDSLTNILCLYNRVWKEHYYPSIWREAIVIPILKPGKVATDPLSYHTIALTSCFCKTFERMVNTRLVYVLEKEKCVSPLQSGFRKDRSPIDNIVYLESQIRDAFVRRNHLVSLFFDIEKAYDRTWRYGILLYGSARASVLRRLDTIHHSALRICTGALRTSPVQSLYVTCNQLPLNLRRKKQALAYYFKILSVRSHSLRSGNLTISMRRIYDAGSHNIRPFMETTKLLLSELDLPVVDIHQRNFLQFQLWNTPCFRFINPYATYSKSAIAPVAFQRIFAYHRSRYTQMVQNEQITLGVEL
ncbi:probable RNA-directed DNA polymerase from transposon X-element [Trichonephila clavipes]|nr:probable RNA-directed DNA polymerase from transposon X-element [Trichonephila clavipes]